MVDKKKSFVLNTNYYRGYPGIFFWGGGVQICLTQADFFLGRRTGGGGSNIF